MQMNLKTHTAFQLAPVETFQMEVSDCQQGSHQLLNFLGSLGDTTIMHAGAWSHTVSGNGTYRNFREPIYGTIHPHLAARTYGALSPTTYPSLHVSAAFSAFSLQVHHTGDHSLQVQGANGHTSQPTSPMITASELNSRTMQVNLHLMPPHCK